MVINIEGGGPGLARLIFILEEIRRYRGERAGLRRQQVIIYISQAAVCLAPGLEQSLCSP